MEIFGHRDFILYLLISHFLIFSDYGALNLLIFVLENFYFAVVKLPYIYLTYRYFCPFPYQTTFSQRATATEFVVVEVLKYYFKYVQQTEIGKVFSDGRVFERINRIRHLREFGNGLGDVKNERLVGSEEEFPDVNGILIYSKSRVLKSIPDIVILYSHGGIHRSGSGHLYSEYLSILLVNLMEQGFKNPCIFIPEFSTNIEKYPVQLCQLIRSYEYLVSLYGSKSHYILAGDSSGATMILSLLLALRRPSNLILESLLHGTNLSKKFKSPELLFAHYSHIKKPSTALLISPITQIFSENVKKSKCDYLTNASIKIWASKYIPNELRNDESEALYFNPGRCNDVKLWKEALPESGLIISYGLEELISDDIEEFIHLIKKTDARIKVDKQVAQIHNWAVLNFYTERLVDHREVSLQIYSTLLSRALLWQSDSHFENGAKNPTNLITIDEDHT